MFQGEAFFALSTYEFNTNIEGSADSNIGFKVSPITGQSYLTNFTISMIFQVDSSPKKYEIGYINPSTNNSISLY